MAGVFPGETGVYNEGNPALNKLRFIAEHGFHGGGLSASELEQPDFLNAISDLAAQYHQSYGIHAGVDFRLDPAAEIERLLAITAQIPQLRTKFPIRSFQVVCASGIHRFLESIPIEEQIQRLTEILTPVALALKGQGLRLLIENHADYYMTDLATLCAAVDNLYILFDTSNCFIVGERPDQVPNSVIPHIYGTHFKDHYLEPEPRKLRLNCRGATLGEGHCNLAPLYQRLCTEHPNPDQIDMLIEWVPDKEKPAMQCFEDSLQFIQKLSNNQYIAPKNKANQ